MLALKLAKARKPNLNEFVVKLINAFRLQEFHPLGCPFFRRAMVTINSHGLTFLIVVIGFFGSTLARIPN